MKELIIKRIGDSIAVKEKLLTDEIIIEQIEKGIITSCQCSRKR